MNTRRVAAGIAWAATAAVALRGLTGTRNTLRSLRWLSQPLPEPSADSGPGRPYFLLVIPMLREQKLIADTVAYFAQLALDWQRACVVVVTTEAEHQRPSRRPSTAQLAAQLAARDHGGAQVIHHHLDDPHGDMADQINYAARVELARLAGEGVAMTDVFMAVYNADSRPEPQTLPTVAATVAASTGVRIVQQSALFTTELGHSMVADGIALLQSRWTLAREIPRLRRQSAQARRTGGRARMPHLAHCVGHGLFVRADVLQAMAGLPTATMNEDLAFGYLACAAGIPIDSLPRLEFGDSPHTVGAAIQQTRQWFWAYPEYPKAQRLAAAGGLGNRWTRTVLAVQGLGRGALWLGQSPAVLATLTLPLLASRKGPAAAVAAGALAAYYVVPFTAITHHLQDRGQEVPGLARSTAGGLIAALASSIGPWWCLGRAARRALFGTDYQHEKTED